MTSEDPPPPEPPSRPGADAGPTPSPDATPTANPRRRRHRLDWNLVGCATGGHEVYAPTEPVLRDRLNTTTALGPAWRCLRCGAFVPDAVPQEGPAAEAPLVRRGREARDAIILRVFAVERWIRALLCVAAAYLILRFASRQSELRQAFDHGTTVIKQIFGQAGFDLQHSKTLELLQRVVDAKHTTLTWVVVGLFGYALIELIEGVGLWLLKRWGEYFAFVATALFLPFEVYELAHGVKPLKVITFAINLALVVYLVVTKRLFGVRGGVRAFEAERRAASLLEIERAAGEAAAE